MNVNDKAPLAAKRKSEFIDDVHRHFRIFLGSLVALSPEGEADLVSLCKKIGIEAAYDAKTKEVSISLPLDLKRAEVLYPANTLDRFFVSRRGGGS